MLPGVLLHVVAAAFGIDAAWTADARNAAVAGASR